ncbi:MULTISPECIES: hypothetical protein [unclassified Moorena]|uniref:hypothetical protein n=1 Tax=unclassified Moorena TaxID=2683338 RepID=UPI0013FF0CEF|nr:MULTISPECIES: hypothetical protein [unclassified Moorena]NEO14944.1 hypothetical protein [Moorena sp. SIO3E8]NEQ01376.1 hypothetical protein [Moorena sp. SIO3F7]
MAKRPRYANNLLTFNRQPLNLQPSTFNLGQKATLREQPLNLQPWPKGHATRTTFNLGQKATLREQPNNLQPWPKGHATRTTC